MRKDVIYVSGPERDQLHAERARAIRECPATRLSNDGRYAVGPKPIGGYLRITGRDTDGSILASVRIFAGDTADTARYVRNLRITTHCKPSTRRVPFRVARGR